MNEIMQDQLTIAYDAFSRPREFGFRRLQDSEKSNETGVYFWRLVGGRFRYVRGLSSIIYVGKGDVRRALGHYKDRDKLNHYSQHYYYLHWRRANKLDVWFKADRDRDTTETRYLHSFFRTHYQLPLLNKQAKGKESCKGGPDSCLIEYIFGNEVWDEVESFLNGVHPDAAPFGVVEGEEEDL